VGARGYLSESEILPSDDYNELGSAYDGAIGEIGGIFPKLLCFMANYKQTGKYVAADDYVCPDLCGSTRSIA